jgi:hypothetical protein
MRLALALLGAPLLLVAQTIDVDFDKTQDFAKFKTFRLLDGTIDAKSPALNNPAICEQIASAIREQFLKKGLTEADTGAQPDLNIRFHLGSPRPKNASAIPAGSFGVPARGGKTEGTLTIDVLVKRELVWRAAATDNNKDSAKIADHLDDMVKKTIAKYPPRK